MKDQHAIAVGRVQSSEPFFLSNLGSDQCFVTQCNQTSLVFCFVPQTAGEKMSRCKTLLAVNIFRGKVFGRKKFSAEKKMQSISRIKGCCEIQLARIKLVKNTQFISSLPQFLGDLGSRSMCFLHPHIKYPLLQRTNTCKTVYACYAQFGKVQFLKLRQFAINHPHMLVVNTSSICNTNNMIIFTYLHALEGYPSSLAP